VMWSAALVATRGIGAQLPEPQRHRRGLLLDLLALWLVSGCCDSPGGRASPPQPRDNPCVCPQFDYTWLPPRLEPNTNHPYSVDVRNGRRAGLARADPAPV
jgi:hypothetical protein